MPRAAAALAADMSAGEAAWRSPQVDTEVDATAARWPDGPITVMCGHGERAMSGASLLEASGRHDLAVLIGGPHDWSGTTGLPLVVA